MHDLALGDQRKEGLEQTIRGMMAKGVWNVLALRGDPPPKMGGKFRNPDGGCSVLLESRRPGRKSARKEDAQTSFAP
jgi:5,10-methylenetetrahydrofolate reductase